MRARGAIRDRTRSRAIGVRDDPSFVRRDAIELEAYLGDDGAARGGLCRRRHRRRRERRLGRKHRGVHRASRSAAGDATRGRVVEGLAAWS